MVNTRNANAFTGKLGFKGIVQIAEELSKNKKLEAYPWDECIADQTKRYGSEAAPKICGYIKEKYG